jgi:hypothetical protein
LPAVQALLEKVTPENQYQELQKDLLLLQLTAVWEQTTEELLEFALHFEKRGDNERAGQTYGEITSLCLDHDGVSALTKARAEIDLLEAGELMHKLGYSLPDVNGLYWNREK